MLGTRELMRSKGKLVVVAGAVAALMATSFVAAYFSAHQSVTNSWTVGNVDIKITETEYDKDSSQRTNITPNKALAKDPVVNNTGSNDAFVFMKLTVPKANVKVASEDGTSVSSGLQELFSYTISNGWTQMSKTEGTDTNTYLFVYGTNTACTALKPSASTPILFNGGKITFKNVIEGQALEGKTLEMPVEAYAIQTADITSNDKTDPESVWGVLNGQVSAL